MANERQQAVVLLSGGLDSTVLCAQLLYENIKVHALIVDYGQRHKRELIAADRVCSALKLPYSHVTVDPYLFHGAKSSQTNQSVAVPEGHYAADNMKLTIVPNRNMLLLAMAASRAMAINADTVAYAAHAGDHAVYPDCRPAFYESCDETIQYATGEIVSMYAPFIDITKTDIVRRGAQLKAPMELTYSCYKGAEAHCGKCGTCVERIEAFKDAGVTDPTVYANA
jgi:7-cyano-7-deazaguanine synthase